MPRTDTKTEGVFKLSNGSRRFLRYGYGDLFQRDRRFDVLFRIWPGTQRTLLWGDPALASGYGHTSHFCGASGIEIFEPLFFKGREGSGLAGGRCAYADESLKPSDGDWSKYRYTYRVWGRNLYNPNADPEGGADISGRIRRRRTFDGAGPFAGQPDTAFGDDGAPSFGFEQQLTGPRSIRTCRLSREAKTSRIPIRRSRNGLAPSARSTLNSSRPSNNTPRHC